jgi:hypothetical protein
LVSAGLTVLDAILEEPAVTFHLGCGVVIVEGLITPAVAARPALIWACNQK